MYIEQCECDNNDCNCNMKREDTMINDPGKDRWDFIINNWNIMNFKERLELFTPKIKYIKTFDCEYGDMTDEFINNSINNIIFDSCRSLKSIKFNANNAVPCILIILNPININNVPDENIQKSMHSWFNKYMN